MSDDAKKKPLQASASALGVRLRGCDLTSDGRTLVTRLVEAGEPTLAEKLEELNALTQVAKAADETARAITAAAQVRADRLRREIDAMRDPKPRPEALRLVAREMESALQRGEKAHDVLSKLRADRPDLAEAFRN
jgi:CHASE3 domain sensor protein